MIKYQVESFSFGYLSLFSFYIIVTVMDIHGKISPYKPAVPKAVLLLLAGTMWFVAGTMLNSLAIKWLDEYDENTAILFAVIGFLLAMAIHHFGFLRVADKNLRRIDSLNRNPCIFAFMSWRSIILIFVMATLGIVLRKSSLPHHLLASLYSGIGIALMLSSIRYFRRAIKSL
jgi:hypothetical protein